MKENTMKQVAATALVVVLAMGMMGIWTEYRARTLSERAVCQYRQEELAFWRSNLLPLYRDMGVVHTEDPTTREEIFRPLIDVLEPLQSDPDE
jgi:hypothetical protein